MSKRFDQLFTMIDVMASEYGWTIDYILKQRIDVLTSLYKKIFQRKKDEYKMYTKLTGNATAAAFAGKLQELDKLFDEKSVDKEDFRSQLEALAIKLGKDPEEVRAKLNRGEEIEL